MKLAYEAIDKSGKIVRDFVDAKDGADAIENLRRQGLFVTEITEASRAQQGRAKITGGVGRGKRLKYLAMFSRQLHVLVHCGIPLTQALEALERQVKPGPWKDVLGQIHASVEEGMPLSEAMAHHPNYFDPIVRSMMEAGEAGGNFAAMLDRMATLVKKQAHTRSTIVGAMVYPCLLIAISLNVLVTMLLFVLPRFAELFKTLDSPLPPSTKFLMAVSGALRVYWWAFLITLVAIVATLKLWLRSPAGKRAIDTLVIRVPKFGILVRNFITARVIRTLGVLLQSKVQLLDALRLTKMGTLNHHYSDLLARAEQAVTRGEPISSAFSRADLIPGNIYEALRNGERSGQVGPLLLNMAEFMDEENEVIMKSLTSIIEPLILIVLGFLVGGVALSMFMPLFDLTSAAQGRRLMKFFGLPERTPIGIDVGARHIKAVQMTHGPRGWRVEATAAFARAVVDAPLSRMEVARLSEVLYRRSFVGRHVVLAVPNDKLIVGAMELPARSAGISLDAAARTEFSRAYKCELNTFEMSYWDLPAPARAAHTTNVMAAACSHRDADELIQLFELSGLEVAGLDARSWAMGRACAPAVEDAPGIVILLDIGWNSALLVLLHHGIVIYERPLSDGGISTLHAAITAELKLTDDVADLLVAQTGLIPNRPEPGESRQAVKIPDALRAEARRLAAAHFERVSQDLLQSISYTSHQYPDAVVSRLLLMGGGAIIPGIAEHMQGLVGFECRLMTPLASASCAPALARECNAALTTAAGLAQFDDR